ncbi:GNAT family N-acetyltransferase [Actinophytocola glycyrrhizae]|uniref:GNAT family N-acetyltransferase n=1 Tax=Actinophytocola glycyrrhizae TaxID=2044873 RepID=A0ABV9RXQ9_9PSEU
MREQLGSGEVTLRRWREQDAPVLYQVVRESMAHLRPWMAWVADGYPPEAAAAFVASTGPDWERGAAFNYAIFVSGRLAGAASLMARIGPGGLELGYWLHPGHVGRGVATRTASLLVAEAFRTGAQRVEIVTDVANTRSAAVPKRLGFVVVDRRPPQEPVTPGEDGLDVIWRLNPDRG